MVIDVLEYVISAHANRPISEINFRPELSFYRGFGFKLCSAKQYGFSFGVSTYIPHDPDRPSYVIEPCKGNVVVSVKIKGLPKTFRSLLPHLEVTTGAKNRIACGPNTLTQQSYEGGKPTGKKECVTDVNLENCQEELYVYIPERTVICELNPNINIPVVLSLGC